MGRSLAILVVSSFVLWRSCLMHGQDRPPTRRLAYPPLLMEKVQSSGARFAM